jgi:DNA-binding SARP family transcriptional activator
MPIWQTTFARFRQNLHVVRCTLDPAAPASATSGYLPLRDEQLALCPSGPLWVDVEVFEEAAATARHALEPAVYRAAIDLYVRELLPQGRYETWVKEYEGCETLIGAHPVTKRQLDV